MTPQPVIVEPAAAEQCSLFARPVSTQSVTGDRGRKLVGIITRADIIRAEADKLNFKTGQLDPGLLPYVVYQTQSPGVGRGRLLVPLANPKQLHHCCSWLLCPRSPL